KVELFEAYKNSLLLVMDLQRHLIEQYNLKVTHDILERLLNYISE
ncbi:lincosamide nucleotidyltransferase Lnu(B), partial [Enterococcus faecalis]